MIDIRQILTNWSKGELSPLIEGRPDLAAYYEGGPNVENWFLLRQGGVTRRYGTRFIHEVKDSTKDVILLPFESSIDDAYIIEMGNGYDRIYKNKAYLGVELVSPYTEAMLRQVHFTQSVDVLFRFHQQVQQHRTARVSDTSWSTLPIAYDPPPSFPDDTDISGGTATLTLAATTGTNVLATASAAVFLEADVGRIIIFGASRALITAFGASAADTASPNDHVRVTVLDAFPDVLPIPAGQWFLRLAPQATLDPDIKEPIGAIATLVAGPTSKPTFRAADLGKFIKIYAGLLVITEITNAFTVKAEILADMTGTSDANPSAAPAGAWGLEISSWSIATGFPGTGELFQGRLYQARTTRQPTTFWGSESDSFERYSVGIEADRAVDYTMATKQLNQIQFLTDNIDLFIYTEGSEHRATGGKSDEPIGGDVIPNVSKYGNHGAAAIQAQTLSRRVIWIDRSRRLIFATGFSLEEDGYDSIELTGAAEHITESGIRFGPSGFQKRKDPRFFWVREDGVLITLTYHHHEKVVGFTRIVTDGKFIAVAVIPGGDNDQIWVIVERVVLGEMKKYVEVFEDNATELAGREWTSCQTDSAKVYDLNGVPTTVLDGLEHLKGRTVDVIVDGSYRGQYLVSNAGTVTLLEAGTQTAEVGLHYDSTLQSFRPSVKDRVTEGLWRQWRKLWVRLHKSMGGRVNGQEIHYAPGPLGSIPMFTGDRDVSGYPDTEGLDGRITIVQDLPYPMTVLAVFGEVQFGDHG